MRSRLVAIVLLAGCGTDSPGSPDFVLACDPPAGDAGCGTVRCTLTPIDGFDGDITLSPTAAAGIRTHGIPGFVEVVDIPAEVLLGFSAETAAGATGQVQLTATSDGLTHDVTIDLDLHMVAPPAQAGTMVLYGCAGLAGVVVGPALNEVYVGAWRNGFTADFCTQTLSAVDGTYQLSIPASCGFAPAETVYLTAGGFDTCTLPFAPDAVQYFDVILTAPCT